MYRAKARTCSKRLREDQVQSQREGIIEASGLSAHDVASNQAPAKSADGLHDSVSHMEGSTPLTTDSSAEKATLLSPSHNSGSLSVGTDSPHEIDPIATLFNNAFESLMLFTSARVFLCAK